MRRTVTIAAAVTAMLGLLAPIARAEGELGLDAARSRATEAARDLAAAETRLGELDVDRGAGSAADPG